MAKKRILHFDGLYGDLDSNKKEGYIFLELIKTRSESFDWKINPHVHSHLYQVFCIESGDVQLETHETTEVLKTPVIIIIAPGILHGLQYSPAVKGDILTLSDTVFETLFASAASLLLHFDGLTVVSFTHQKKAFTQLMDILKQVKTELFNEKTEKKLLTESLLRQFFIVLQRHSETRVQPLLPDTNQTLLHYRRFVQLVKATNIPQLIPAYAKEIGISAVHLNRICNQVCGKSALLIVQEHLVEQSKNHLAHSTKSIAEIAYLLNFEYPNYFARLFKKLNGISPKEYRKTKR
jgi:AraC family transcriptional regulator, transcriptional activator of pobA